LLFTLPKSSMLLILTTSYFSILLLPVLKLLIENLELFE
jgi:hypothetical protein